VEVAQHFIAGPPTEKAYFVGVDFGTEEGHCPTGTKRADGDVGGHDADRWHSEDCLPETLCQCSGVYGGPSGAVFVCV
jgi:hypothetical protein